MKSFLVLVLSLAGCLAPSSAKSIGGCDISVKTGVPKKNDPVYLEKGKGGKLQLALPDPSGGIVLSKGQELILACTGGKNSLTSSGQEVTSASCVTDSVLKVGKTNAEASQIDCNKRSSASLLITKTSCGPNSYIIQSGFEIDDDWFPLVDTCHNMEEGSSSWSRHTLYGTRLAAKVIQSNRPGFSRGLKHLYSGFNPDDMYQQSNQEVLFVKLFGSKLGSSYIRPDEALYLARGHLAPDADFLFASWQMMTYFFVNAAPQWQSINAGNWLAVENNARKVAINRNADLDDITGTYGILELMADDKKTKPVYLADGKNPSLPAPELYWKVLADPKDKSCIVLVSTNNPFLTKPPTPICKDVCAKAGWPNLKSDFKKGYVYCCEYADFKKAVPNVPDLSCKSILEFK